MISNKSVFEKYSYNPNDRFDYFNKLFFNNSLTKIPIYISTAKLKSDAAGLYSVTRKCIELYDDGKISDKYIDSVLIHEMIHHWVYENNLEVKQHHSKVFKNKVDEINKVSNNLYKVGYTEVSASINDDDDTLEEKIVYWLFPLSKSSIAYSNLIKPIQVLSKDKFNFTEVTWLMEKLDYKENRNIRAFIIAEVTINNNFITEDIIKDRIDVFATGSYGFPSNLDKWMIQKMKQSGEYRVIGKYDWSKEAFVKTNKEGEIKIMKNNIILKEGQTVIDEKGREYLIEKGDRLIESDIYIDFKSLQDAFPALAREYKDIYGGKKPKIKVTTQDTFIFNPSVSNGMVDYYVDKVYIFYREGQIVSVFDASKGVKPERTGNLSLKDEDAIMICNTGYYKYCELIVNPSFMNPEQITGDIGLSSPEIYALLVANSINSAYRKEYLIQPLLKIRYGGISNYRNFKPTESEFKSDVKALSPNSKTFIDAFTDTIYPMLAEKGLVKINSRGSVQITLDGKNQAEQYR